MTEAQFFKTGYDRATCSIGIVHVGFGAFHRAHQAVYIDDYMQATGDLRWGIAAVNLRASESADFAAAAAAKDGYLLKSIAPSGDVEFRAVRSHKAHVDAAKDLDAALALLSRPSVKVVSMTVTESGYAFNDDWSLDLSSPAIREELSGGSIQTVYGYLAAALDRRSQELDAPITVLCCDNIRNNGKVLKGALLSYLDAAGKPALAEWVRKNATFPCSMVDRITPRSTPELETEVARMFPTNSLSPIHAEAFTQWVLHNDFAGEMPDLARVGVQVVDSVEPFEEAKIRILNGGHTGLTYLGALAGLRTFDQAMHDTELRAHFDRFEQEDVLRGLGDSIPFDTAQYLEKIAARFENPGIADQLERICMDGYSKMAIYIRPTLHSCLHKGLTPSASYDCVASWVVYARRFKAGKTDIPYHEPFWEKLAPMLDVGKEADIATDPMIWGDLPHTFDSFSPNLVAAIKRMETRWQA